jgi:hypothetical protein
VSHQPDRIRANVRIPEYFLPEIVIFLFPVYSRFFSELIAEGIQGRALKAQGNGMECRAEITLACRACPDPSGAFSLVA